MSRLQQEYKVIIVGQPYQWSRAARANEKGDTAQAVWTIRGRLIALLSVLGLALSVQPAAPQQDLIFGTWKINTAKTPNPPRSETRIYENRGDGFILSTRQGLDVQGREYFSEYAAKHDGKDYPRLVKGGKELTTIAFQQVDPYTSTFTLKSDGKITAMGKTTLSKDGTSLTVEMTNVRGDRSTEIYDKQ